ncbi:MAG TPA: hypothetical protein VIE68_05115 [Gemmatimonadota bacterium]
MRSDTNHVSRPDHRKKGLLSVGPRFVFLGSGFFLDRETRRVVAL